VIDGPQSVSSTKPNRLHVQKAILVTPMRLRQGTHKESAIAADRGTASRPAITR
jgi:hypothetical protein